MIKKTYSAIEKVDSGSTLRITVSSAVVGSCYVSSGETTISRHLRKVECAVQTARKVGYVDIEGELLVQCLEHDIVRVIAQEIKAGTAIAEINGDAIT